jgi:hypothetical protein
MYNKKAIIKANKSVASANVKPNIVYVNNTTLFNTLT